jgi:hypothetical protein
MASLFAKQSAAIVRCVISLAILLALVAAVRLPFLPNIMIGEEGSHAYLVIGPAPVIRGLDALYIGRLNGVDYLVFPEHNILMYDFFDIVGRGLGRLLSPCQCSSIEDAGIDCISHLARTPFLIIFLIALLIAIPPLQKWLAVERPATFLLQWLTLLFMLTTPLLVGGSIQPQIDGSLGVLIAAVSAALMTTAQIVAGRSRFLLYFLAGLATSLGKIEWAMALFGALVLTLALAIAVAYDRQARRFNFAAAHRSLEVCAGALAGILFGQLLVFLYSPTAYLAGFELMRELDVMHMSVLGAFGHSWPFAYPAFIMIGACMALIALRLRHIFRSEPAIAAIVAWAAAITTGYVYSGWSGDGFPRYYCPAGLLAAIALVCLLRDVRLPKVFAGLALAALLAGLGLNGASLFSSYSQRLSISSYPGMSLEQVRDRYLEHAQAYHGVPVPEWSAFGIYFRSIDWAASDMGRQAAIEFVQEHRPEVQAEFEASIH